MSSRQGAKKAEAPYRATANRAAGGGQQTKTLDARVRRPKPEEQNTRNTHSRCRVAHGGLCVPFQDARAWACYADVLGASQPRERRSRHHGKRPGGLDRGGSRRSVRAATCGWSFAWFGCLKRKISEWANFAINHKPAHTAPGNGAQFDRIRRFAHLPYGRVKVFMSYPGRKWFADDITPVG